ncbi:hypothetical protein IJ579_04160 [bacterium]|nr:hypothetical protein [bacterium]
MKAGTNFSFLKDIDKNLYEIITEAENLYRGEFFEQSITQTRRFGEHICRNVLGQHRTTEITFDEMLATLKDKTGGSEQEKEFINDLYFLKKQGNSSVHSGTVKKDAIVALECLQRAFEAGLNYAVYNKNAQNSLLTLNYDIDLLVTGKKSKKTLQEKYLEEKQKNTTTKFKPKKTSSKTTKKSKKQVSSMKSISQKSGVSLFWIIVGIFLIITLCTVLFLFI